LFLRNTFYLALWYADTPHIPASGLAHPIHALAISINFLLNFSSPAYFLSNDPKRCTMENDFPFIQRFVTRMMEIDTDEELLNLVIDQCIAYTGATSGTMSIISDNNHLDIKVARGFTENVKQDCRLIVGEGITGHVAATGKPWLCPDTGLDPHYVNMKDGIQSEVAVPIRIQGQTIGVINLDSHMKNAFNKHHVDVLMILAANAALIYNRLAVIDNLKTKILYGNILLESAEILNSDGNLRQKFASIMDILHSRLGMSRGTIVLRKEADLYAIHTAIGLKDDEILKGVYKPGEGITGRIILSGEAYAVRNIYDEPAFLNRTSARKHDPKDPRPLSFIGVPIRIMDDTVGVLSVDKPFDGRTFDEDISMLTILSSLLGQALQVEDLTRTRSQRLFEENEQLKEVVQSRYACENIIGVSPPMLDIYKKIDLVSASETTVLITGESGTGKELVAEAIHNKSARHAAPLVKLNCAAIPEGLLESELFGHKKGAFTGASRDRTGRITQAHGGTLFLDEIGDMPISMQTKLLRVIQNREVDIVGGNTPLPVDVRILAATSRKLETLVRDGSFREDLFYRLNVFRIHIPALRERREDIGLIAREYLKKLSNREHCAFQGISYEAVAAITELRLEGNVRELQNIIEQAFLIAGKGRIELEHLGLSRSLRQNASEDASRGGLLDVASIAGGLASQTGDIFRSVIGEVEHRLVQWALERTGGNRSEAARLLGINRNTLNSKIL